MSRLIEVKQKSADVAKFIATYLETSHTNEELEELKQEADEYVTHHLGGKDLRPQFLEWYVILCVLVESKIAIEEYALMLLDVLKTETSGFTKVGLARMRGTAYAALVLSKPVDLSTTDKGNLINELQKYIRAGTNKFEPVTNSHCLLQIAVTLFSLVQACHSRNNQRKQITFANQAEENLNKASEFSPVYLNAIIENVRQSINLRKSKLLKGPGVAATPPSSGSKRKWPVDEEEKDDAALAEAEVEIDDGDAELEPLIKRPKVEAPHVDALSKIKSLFESMNSAEEKIDDVVMEASFVSSCATMPTADLEPDEILNEMDQCTNRLRVYFHEQIATKSVTTNANATVAELQKQIETLQATIKQNDYKYDQQLKKKNSVVAEHGARNTDLLAQLGTIKNDLLDAKERITKLQKQAEEKEAEFQQIYESIRNKIKLK